MTDTNIKNPIRDTLIKHAVEVFSPWVAGAIGIGLIALLFV